MLKKITKYHLGDKKEGGIMTHGYKDGFIISG